MRLLLSTLLFLTITSAFSQTDCSDLFSKQRLDSIKQEIDAFHTELVERGLVADMSAKSLHDFIKIQAPSLFDTIRRQERDVLTESAYDLLQGDCRLALNELEDFDKIIRWEMRVMNALDTVTTFSENPNIAGEVWAKSFKDEDFETRTIRRKFLLTIYSITLPFDNHIGLLPSFGDSVVTTPFQTEVLMNKNQVLFMDNIETDISGLQGILIKRIQKHKNELTLVFKVAKEVGYDAFLKAVDLISDSYTEVQNDLAQQLYQKNLDALTSEESHVVKDRIQRKIITKMIDL